MLDTLNIPVIIDKCAAVPIAVRTFVICQPYQYLDLLCSRSYDAEVHIVCSLFLIKDFNELNHYNSTWHLFYTNHRLMQGLQDHLHVESECTDHY